MIPRPRKNRMAIRAIEHSPAHESGDQGQALCNGKDVFPPAEKSTPRATDPQLARGPHGQISSDYETPEQFGAHYGRSAKTIRMWVQRGWVSRLKLGKNILIPKSEHREIAKRFMIRACGRGE